MEWLRKLPGLVVRGGLAGGWLMSEAWRLDRWGSVCMPDLKAGRACHACCAVREGVMVLGECEGTWLGTSAVAGPLAELYSPAAQGQYASYPRSSSLWMHLSRTSVAGMSAAAVWQPSPGSDDNRCDRHARLGSRQNHSWLATRPSCESTSPHTFNGGK